MKAKVIRNCIGLSLIRSVMVQKTSHRYSLNQSDGKLKPITIWSLEFSRALGSMVVLTLSS